MPLDHRNQKQKQEYVTRSNTQQGVHQKTTFQIGFVITGGRYHSYYNAQIIKKGMIILSFFYLKNNF